MSRTERYFSRVSGYHPGPRAGGRGSVGSGGSRGSRHGFARRERFLGKRQCLNGAEESAWKLRAGISRSGAVMLSGSAGLERGRGGSPAASQGNSFLLAGANRLGGREVRGRPPSSPQVKKKVEGK